VCFGFAAGNEVGIVFDAKGLHASGAFFPADVSVVISGFFLLVFILLTRTKLLFGMRM